jgi:hypothetical protein
VFYVHGSWFRSHSKYAREVAEEREELRVKVSEPTAGDAEKNGRSLTVVEEEVEA